MQKTVSKLNLILRKIDQAPLWLLALPLIAVILLPCLLLGEGSVFVIHDQLDESLMNYVLTARHLGESTIPEMLGGISASGLTPAAVLFVLLYRLLPAFTAFLICYAFIVLAAFLGMYLAVRELTGSSILGALFGGIFCLLGDYPIYGLSQAGIPLIFYAFLCLRRCEKNCENRWQRLRAIFLTILFGITSHLVCTGYVVLGLWLVALLIRLVRCGKGQRKVVLCGEGLGFGCLLVTYCFTNAQLIGEFLFGNIGEASHREEMVNSAQPFWESVWDMLWNGQYHATSYHKYMVVPILVLLVIGGIVYQKLNAQARKCYRSAVLGMELLIGIAVFYGICKSEPVVAWKNSVNGFLHYFQADRINWLYPAGWYLELALLLGMWRRSCERQDSRTELYVNTHTNFVGTYRIICNPCICLLVSALTLLPTAYTVLYQSNFYRNVNQYNNGSGITGYISWESYYSEDLMQEIEDAIGRDMSTYRIAHLGISPAPSLMHGFYTVDGYSNNYPLAYKHAFREVIAAELDKAPVTAVYFDSWGSRCYLFNSQTGYYWMMEKGNGNQYEGLEFDMDALAGLGCEYLFSGGEIVDAEDMGLELMGYFETESSYWGVWLYALDE